MNSNNPKDPVEGFRVDRRIDSGAPRRPLDFANIDDMLDRIDLVFQAETELPDVTDQVEAESLRLICRELRLILEHLDAIESKALKSELSIALAEFCTQTRVRASDMLCVATGGEKEVQAGSEIEYEIDYARLHEFMLCPELDVLAAAS